MSDYGAFRSDFMARHEHPATRALSTMGDALWLASIPAGLATRKLRVGLGVYALGWVVAAVAHLFQPGTAKEEILAVVRHPVWATRAETERLRRSR